MAIRNGDEVKFQGENGEVRGTVLTIGRKGPNKGQAYLQIHGPFRPRLVLGIWVDVGRLQKS